MSGFRWYHVAVAILVPVVLLSAIGGVLAYHQVPEGHVGVETEWDSVTGHIDSPGANWKIPIAQDIQDVEVRPRTYTMAESVGEGEKAQKNDAIEVQTVNGSTVDVDVTIRYRVDADQADTFVEDWSNVDQAEQRLMRPTVRSEMRDEAASVKTSEIYTSEGREALAQAAHQALDDEFEDEPLVLEAVQVRKVNLPDEIDRALDEKEIAKQRAQVETERIEQEEARAEQARVEAQGEADVIEIQGDALRSNEIVLDSRMIDAYDEGTIFVTDGDQGIMLDGTQAGQTNSSTVPSAPGDD